MDNSNFEKLLNQNKDSLERFVYYRMPSKEEGDDILQEIYLSAIQHFSLLKDSKCFKSWILQIAANKCNDFYRSRARQFEISLDEIVISSLSQGPSGIYVNDIVQETLSELAGKDQQILFLYYFQNKSQAEIAKLLHVPVGTVKSRLYTAKQNFKMNYPYPPISKGANYMKKFPEIIPDYTIAESDKKPFEVKWEELMGWFIIPKIGEKLSWGMYDFPSKKIDHIYDMKVIGEASVHGINGVEITARESSFSKKKEKINRTFIAQMTDTHTRYLAAFRTEDNVRKYMTFLDEDFLKVWGFGGDNCGKEIYLKTKNKIVCSYGCIQIPDDFYGIDIIGRYTLNISGKTYDTIRVIEFEKSSDGVMCEQYLDQNGKTILWRRFNCDNWAFSHYKQLWTEKLPENERIIINGETFVHWYDCITEYIL